MKNIDLLPHEIYHAHLKEINGTEFSLREVEIMASLFLSDNTKQSPDVIPLIEEESKDHIKYTYKIASSTVFTHIAKICGKLQKSAEKVGILLPNKSRKSDIIKYILEQSDIFPLFEQYCTALRLETAFLNVVDRIFKQYADEIKKREPAKTETGVCHIYVEYSDVRMVPSFYKNLARYLNDRKEEDQPKIMTTVIKAGEWEKEIADDIDYAIYVVSESSEIISICQENLSSPFAVALEKRSERNPGSVVFLLDQWQNNELVPPLVKRAGYLLIDGYEHYYQQTFNILKGIFPMLPIDTKIADFQKTFLNYKSPQSIFHKMRWFVVVGLFFITSFLFLSVHNQTIDSFQIIARSDIKIPRDALLLKRLTLIHQMHAQLRTQNTIQPVALTGMGGAGKTTLARMYAHAYMHAVVWEINAETKETVIDSFMSLATTLARTKEDKEAVSAMKALQNEKDKEQQLMDFIKRHLRSHANWLLIYDNVESFNVINNFFPYDSTAWGKGNVIITTCDKNIINSQYVGEANTIHINPLTYDEAFALFCHIVYQKESHVISAQDREKISLFLKNIPPFPLDVVVAAYYIKNVVLTFDQYSELIAQNSQAFDKSQYLILKEIADYTQTRYGLVTASIRKLLDLNPEYVDLLFLMCLLDSQKIPLDFLLFCKDPVLVGLFIRDMKKFSFISDQFDHDNNKQEHTLSFHRSIQTLAQCFLREHLSHQQQQNLLDTYNSRIKDYYDTHVYQQNSKLSSFTIHLESLLKNIENINLPDKEKYTQTICYVLGHSYYHTTRHFLKEKEYFERAYQLQETTHFLSSVEIASMLKLLTYVCLELKLKNEAIGYAEKGLQVCDTLPNSALLESSILKVMGFAYLQDNNFEQSKYYFEKALHKIRHLDSAVRKDSESSIYSYMGLLYGLTHIRGNNVQKGLDYAHKALELVEGTSLFYKMPIPKELLSCRVVEHKVNLGEICCLLGRYQEAYEHYFKDALFIAEHSLDKCTHMISKVLAHIGIGEYYLRTNKLELAKARLTDSFNETERFIGKDNSFITKLAVFRAETYIRLGELEQAYADCLLVFKEDKETKTNYLISISLMAYYHAAVICYKQGKLKEAYQYFSDFFEKTKLFYKMILHDSEYQQLEEKHVFDISKDQQTFLQKTIKECFTQSSVLFSTVYGEDHPFVRDYVLVNQRGM